MTKDSKQKTVVYTYGVFDLFHRGHVELLRDAHALGDELVVGVFSDEAAESFKRRPVICLEDRLHMIRHCQFVDRVVIQHELSPEKNILELRPHILAKGPGAGWGEGEETPGSAAMQEIHGKIVLLNYHDGISTSQIIKKIVGGKN